MKRCICSFNVPVAYNDDSPEAPHPVEPELFDAIERALDRQFGGYTDLGRRPGSWQGQKEVSAWYCVYVEPERIQVLRQIITEIGVKLGQKQMALEISAATSELIDIEPEEPGAPPPAKKLKKKKKDQKTSTPIVLWPEEEKP